MTEPIKAQVVTANDLFEGDVVYLTAAQHWTRYLVEAAVARTDDEAEALLAAATPQQHRVVGPYLAGVELAADGTVTAAHFREAFRTRGPSNYFHGKQAEV